MDFIYLFTILHNMIYTCVYMHSCHYELILSLTNEELWWLHIKLTLISWH